MNFNPVTAPSATVPIRIAPALILKPMLGLLLSMGLNMASHAEVYTLSVPVLHSHANERAKVHQWVNLGQAEFPTGIRIPAYGISIQNPVEDGLLRSFTPCRATACTFGLKLNSAIAQQLALYQVAGVGWFLAPRHWKTIEASMGPSGIAALTMFSPDGKQYLTLSDTSACVGCALTAASLFFKEAEQQAKKNEFGTYSRANVALKKVPLNPHTVLYSYQLPQQYRTDGVAKFSGMQADIVNFREMTVTLNPANQPLARAMLNFYVGN